MGKLHIIEEINQHMNKEITPEMSIAERKALRTKITNEVLEKRADAVGIHPNKVKDAWDDAIAAGLSLIDVEKKLGL